MAITLVDSVNAGPGANGGATGAMDTTGANLVVVSVSSYTGGVSPSLSDSKGNTYAFLTVRSSGFIQEVLFYKLTPTVGAAHTVTATGTGSYPAILAYAFAGVASYHSESGAVNASSPVVSGTVTPSANGALIFTGFGADNTGTDTVSPGGFTQATRTYGAGNNMQGSAAYYVQPTAAGINPTWAWTGAHPVGAVASAVFLATVVASTGSAYTFLR